MSEREKDGFVIYASYYERFEDLSSEKFGDLIRLLCLYSRTGEEPKIKDKELQLAFKFAKVDIDKNSRKYNDKCEKNRANAKKGWDDKKKEKAEAENNANACERMRTHANEADRIGKDRIGEDRKGLDKTFLEESKNDISDTLSIERDASTSENIMIPRETEEEIKQAWNALGLSQVQKISKERKKALKKILNEYGLEGFYKVIEEVKLSSFLRGESDSTFSAGFDWILKDDNFLKIIEGNYRDKKKKRKEDLINDTSGYGEINGMYDGFADSISKKAE